MRVNAKVAGFVDGLGRSNTSVFVPSWRGLFATRVLKRVHDTRSKEFWSSVKVSGGHCAIWTSVGSKGEPDEGRRQEGKFISM